MQSAPETSHFWQNVWTLLAGGGIATTIGVVAKVVLDWKKRTPEIQESQTRARLNEAEANNKDAATMTEVFRTLRLAYKKLDEESNERRELAAKLADAQETIEQLTEANCRLTEENQRFRGLIKLD